MSSANIGRWASTQQRPLCPDWVVSINSNVLVAKDREWFTEYTPFRSHVKGHVVFTDSPPLPVIGVGTVEIPTRIKPKVHRKIRLRNVVHCPGGICNIMGLPQDDDEREKISLSFEKAGGKICDPSGEVLAVMSPNRQLPCLQVSGPPVGPATVLSMFAPGGNEAFIIGAFWPEEERRRWKTQKKSMDDSGMMYGTSGVAQGYFPSETPQPRYNAEEKAWLKKNYGNEFKFLLAHGLKIFKEGDRDEGKAIVQAMMKNESRNKNKGTRGGQDEDRDASDDELDEETEVDDFLRDLEEDPMSHVADYRFSEPELDFIKKHYKHSGNFLLSYGLKPFDDSDCMAGKQILAEMAK